MQTKNNLKKGVVPLYFLATILLAEYCGGTPPSQMPENSETSRYCAEQHAEQHEARRKYTADHEAIRKQYSLYTAEKIKKIEEETQKIIQAIEKEATFRHAYVYAQTHPPT